MPDKRAEEKRPWWKVRRVWGGIIGTAAAALATIPGAPVIATLGAIGITTQTAAVVLGGIGTYVFGYGQGRKVEREQK